MTPAFAHSGQCGGPNGTVAPTFTPSDLSYLLYRISLYQQDPSQLYGPGPWTNWYRSADERDALAKLAVSRGIFDISGLWNIYRDWFPAGPVCGARDLEARTADGTCNDLTLTAMGSAGTRFTRILPPFSPAAQADAANLMNPNPREVSRVLLTRDDFEPLPFLNLLGTAWIQFQIHDWFNHTNSTHDFFQVPLDQNDPLANGPGGPRSHMLVAKTAPDGTRRPSEAHYAPTSLNEVTHWWDASQIYGSDAATASRLRTHQGGKLRVDANGRVPVAADGFEDTGMRANWWMGLGLVHDLFVKEHNAIADMLAATYPSWSDDRIYDKARLVNSALIAKIHTLEWTPGILPNPSLEVGMNANWGGINQYFTPQFPALPPGVPPSFSPVLFGVLGQPKDLKRDPLSGAPAQFAFPESFISVYRMHPLLPDRIKVRQVDNRGPKPRLHIRALRDAAGRQTQERIGEANLLYTFGVEKSGALTLHNYPTFLQDLDIPRVGRIDLGAVDVLRDRERGVARYNDFRRQLLLPPVPSIDALTPDPELRAELKQVYGSDPQAIERVDLMVGTFAEAQRPDCYGFGETLFTLFTGLATRRLQADRFYTDDFRPGVYTVEGIQWVQSNTLKSVLLRHYPELAQTGLANVTNAFYPWE